ncbi:MAG: hypothetical protein LBP92_03575 [Deltaproteobacteria bacterium]|jgi:hypothetical protein|nr:hypothetical protein [Deltaproteobacteria bacterium]
MVLAKAFFALMTFSIIKITIFQQFPKKQLGKRTTEHHAFIERLPNNIKKRVALDYKAVGDDTMIIYHASNVVVAQPKILQTGRMLNGILRHVKQRTGHQMGPEGRRTPGTKRPVAIHL